MADTTGYTPVEHLHAPDLGRDTFDRKLEKHSHTFVDDTYAEHQHGGVFSGVSYLPEAKEVKEVAAKNVDAGNRSPQKQVKVRKTVARKNTKVTVAKPVASKSNKPA